MDYWRAASGTGRSAAQGGGRGQAGKVTARDREILRWLARHRFAMAWQVREAFGVSRRVAYRRLARLEELGLVEHEWVLHGEPGVYLATRAGTEVGALDLPPATVDLRSYRHALALVSLSIELAPQVAQVVTEREIRQADSGKQRRADLEYAVSLGGGGGEGDVLRLHIPDLVLVHHDGQKEAIEVELSQKANRRLRMIIGGVLRARHLERGVTYYTPQPTVRRVVETAAREQDAHDVVRVREWSPPEEGSQP